MRTQVITQFFPIVFAIYVGVWTLFSGTSLQPYLLVCSVLFTFFFAFTNDWSVTKKFGVPLMMVLLLSSLLCISSIYTHSVPLTLQKMATYAQMAIFLLFFLLQKFAEKDIVRLLQYIGISLAILSVIAISLIILPGIGSTLPPMNMVFPTYGHSHLAALLVLFYPVLFFLAFKQEKKSLNWVGVFLLVTIALLLSFGRVATVIGAAQLVVLFVSQKDILLNRMWSRIAIGATGLLFAALSLFFLYSAVLGCPTYIQQNTFISSKSFFCQKKLVDEPRFFYWSQALQAIQDFPIVGYGPGTFGLVSEKYRQIPNMKTLFAHNEYLEVFAESGIGVGVMSIVLVFLPIFYFLQVRKKQKWGSEDIYTYLLLGYVSFLALLFFDYSLRFVPVQILFSAVLGLLIKKYYLLKNKDIKGMFVRPLALVAQIVWVSAATILTSYVLVEIAATFSGKTCTNSLAMLEPKFAMKVSAYSAKSTCNLAKELYSNHSFWVEEFDRGRQSQINPWTFVSNLAFSSDPITRENVSFSEMLLAEAKEKYHYDAYVLAQKLSKKSHEKSQQLYDQGNIQEAHEYYLLAAKLHPWSIHEHRLPLDEMNPNPEDCRFLQSLQVFPVEPFGDTREQAAWAYIHCSETQSTAFSLKDRRDFENRALRTADWAVDYLPK